MGQISQTLTDIPESDVAFQKSLLEDQGFVVDVQSQPNGLFTLVARGQPTAPTPPLNQSSITIDQSALAGAIRNRPISSELATVLEKAAESAGVDVVRVISGGQPGTTGQSVGSTRHNAGRAADLQLIVGGQALSFTDEAGGDVVEAFVRAAAANGATGIGAGIGYMGDKTMHVGFGLTPQDHSKLVWGAGGRSANAPEWLRRTAQEGWNSPITAPAGSDGETDEEHAIQA